MKLYTSMGPNPAVVAMFLAEKGAEIPTEKVDLMAGENRQPPYVAKNPAGQLPCLELDDGSHLAEITAICEYLEEIHPEPQLLPGSARDRATVRGMAMVVACDTPEETKATLAEIQASGVCWCGGAVWQNEPVIRVSVCSWRTTT